MNTFTINGTRLAKVVGHYSHVYMLDYDTVELLAKDTGITMKEATGCICIFWPNISHKPYSLFTREMICNTQFDFNRFAFHDENIYEKAFRHKLVQILNTSFKRFVVSINCAFRFSLSCTYSAPSRISS